MHNDLGRRRDDVCRLVSEGTGFRIFRYVSAFHPIRASAPSDTHRQRWSRDGYLWSLCLPSYKNNLGKNVGIPIIASIFADTFIYYDVIRQAADLKAHELLARKCDPQERSDALRHREEAESKCRLVDRMRVWKHTPSDVVAESISIGDIRVTPFSNCHSILHKDADAEL